MIKQNITINRITIFPPKTIIYWSDNTRTEVNCDTNPFDEEKGVLLCICKKFLGSYSEVVKAVDMGKNNIKDQIKKFNEENNKYVS
jgi:hypothetical protein